MPKYLFTSDQRISVLPDRIQWVSGFIQKGHSVSDITDKSDNNNAATLKFYYNLHAGTETCKKAVDNPFFAIRNFVLKFQFPNVRTPDSLVNSLEERTLFAPFRSVVSILYRMASTSDSQSAQLSIDEILYFLFCNPDVYKNPLVNYNIVIANIEKNRVHNIDLANKVAEIIEWNQYRRQVKEMLNVLTYVSPCFKLSKGILYFSLASDEYKKDKEFIEQLLDYSRFWYPTNPNNFNLATSEYISYMDTKNTPYSIIDFNIVQSTVKPLQSDLSLQQIYYGAPGTGKSHIINDVTKGESVIRTTFHPDSDYSTFVGAYKPTTKEVILRDLSGHPVIEGDVTLTENKIVYEFVDQSFLKAYIQAWKFYAEADGEKEPKKQFLVIEEINRGNCAQIFGDLFQLLDRNNAGFSDYPINADNDMKKQLAKAFKGLSIASAESINAQYNSKDMVSKVLSGEILLLPNNLYIWATMNTSDQSLFPIDSAFKRRWEWKYMKIKEGKDENGNSLDWKIVVKDADGNNRQINSEDSLSWWTFIQKINDIIASMTSSADKQLGYFFCKAKDGVISGDKFVSKVVFYLWNDVFKDYGFEDASLFRYETVVDGKSTEKDLTFPDFYDEEGENINVDRLVDFLEKVLAWQKPEDNA